MKICLGPITTGGAAISMDGDVIGKDRFISGILGTGWHFGSAQNAGVRIHGDASRAYAQRASALLHQRL